MPKRGALTNSKQTVDGLSVQGRETVFWDREPPGFGVRVYPSGSKIHVVQSRGPSGIRSLSLDRHVEIAAEAAYKKAASAIARIKKGEEPGARQTHIANYWYRVRERAGLDDVRLHDLRHSFASRALALGEDLTMIGKLLGHKKIQTTARYAHLARDSVKES